LVVVDRVVVGRKTPPEQQFLAALAAVAGAF
jgi:hypothetical protein